MDRHKHKHSDRHRTRRNLMLATALNLIIALAEAIGGVMSGSLALLSDAVHNLGDSFSTLIAYVASIYSDKSANARRTFGYKRIEIIAALFNALSRIGITIFLFFEAYKRFLNPVEVSANIMLIVAMIGLLANVYAVLLLKKDEGKGINIRAAYVHLIGDSLSSAVVIIGGLFIKFLGIIWIDPLITVLIGLYILKEAIVILFECLSILMQNTPSNIDLNEIKKELEKSIEVKNIHHIHAWNLTDKKSYFECHVEVKEDYKLSELNKLRRTIELFLHEQYGFDHVTLQIEYNSDHNPEGIHQ